MTSFAGTVVEAGATVLETADLSIGEGAVVVVGANGRRFEIPFDDLRLQTGGFEGDVVFCRPSDGSVTAATSAPGFVDALAAAGGEVLAAELRKVRAQVRGRRSRKLVVAGIALALLAVVVAVLWQVPSWVAGSIDALPTSVDRQLGDAAFEQMDLGGERVQSEVIDAFLAQVVSRLEPHAAAEGLEFRVAVVRSEDVNAFALPGGQMVVLTGLLETADGPEEVAGVMAHEMAHATLRHGLRKVALEVGLMVGLQILLGDAEAWIQLAGEAAVLASANAYSRDEEAAADLEGARMLAAAGLPPEGLIRFFERLSEMPGTELSGAMSWLSSHPAHAERVAAVRAAMPALPRGAQRPLDVDWAGVQAAAR